MSSGQSNCSAECPHHPEQSRGTNSNDQNAKSEKNDRGAQRKRREENLKLKWMPDAGCSFKLNIKGSCYAPKGLRRVALVFRLGSIFDRGDAVVPAAKPDVEKCLFSDALLVE